MKYTDYYKIEPNTPIWACAYQANSKNSGLIYKCEPVQGEIDLGGKFHKYKRNRKLASSEVSADSRAYADTYEECLELYNELVQNRIDELNRIIEHTKKDFIIK